MDRQKPSGTNQSPWCSVVLTFGRFMVAAEAVPGGGELIDSAVGLIQAIEGAQDTQAEMLNASMPTSSYCDCRRFETETFVSTKLHASIHKAGDARHC